MVVRASCDMEAGTEITFWYHNPSGNSAKELQEKLKNWSFVCGCAICLDARTTDATVVVKRRKLMENLRRKFNSPVLRNVQMENIEHLLNELNETYTQPAEDVPRLLLWDPQLALARIYVAQKKVGKSLESVRKVLTSLGYVVVGVDSSHTRFTIVRWGLLVDHVVETFLHARTAFATIGDRKNSKRAEEYAKTAHKIVVGEDTSFRTT